MVYFYCCKVCRKGMETVTLDGIAEPKRKLTKYEEVEAFMNAVKKSILQDMGSTDLREYDEFVFIAFNPMF